MADKYGISAARLVNSYMQPGNPAAKTDFRSALAAAIADDVWADAARRAGVLTGDPARDDIIWREHWYAANMGGRDPLEGHPASVQLIQDAARRMESENVAGAYGTYQQLLTSGLI
jgi:hypothetical protein